MASPGSKITSATSAVKSSLNTPSMYMYEPLSKEIREASSGGSSSKRTKNDPDAIIEAFLKSHVEKKKIDNGLMMEIKNQALLMSGASKGKKPLHQQPQKNKLTSKMKKKLKLFEIPKEEQKFSLYQPIHQLWVGYIRDLLRGGPNPATINSRLTKADYHGCRLTVYQSKCPTYVGINGIVLRETQNTLQLICEDDKLRSVPKGGSIFSFALDGVRVKIYGNHIKFRPSERSARKFKDRPSIQL